MSSSSSSSSSILSKRKAENSADTSNAIVLKRQKITNNRELAVSEGNVSKALIPAKVIRTSNLTSPIMQLYGHQEAINNVEFDPTGVAVASCSSDKNIMIYEVYGDCNCFSEFKGHSGPVLDIKWSTDSSLLYSASADKHSFVWDSEYVKRIKKFRGHTGIVNSLSTNRRGPDVLVTASDDCTAKLWDLNSKNPTATFDHPYPVTSVTFDDNTEKVITGSVDNIIRVWDMKTNKILYTMEDCEDVVTSLSVSPDGSFLLSNSMDNNVRVFDIRPFVADENKRCIKTFQGANHNYEKLLIRANWSPDGNKIVCGSADRFVYIWDSNSREILYKLPGHKGVVTSVSFHPNEPIIASSSTDKTIYLGEINPN
eukprot:TRINITY_DN1425_c0_g1_i1.p1 TRINITY_DN1425_c0_g1~~TRINITY_DN1425_c0_g1_i1.p1  ORF type:complete len:369 (+),score=97.90 TRINITY_DN1425_c0_g1_i1:191-1297(+)